MWQEIKKFVLTSPEMEKNVCIKSAKNNNSIRFMALNESYKHQEVYYTFIQTCRIPASVVTSGIVNIKQHSLQIVFV
jgi:hypothetical protein